MSQVKRVVINSHKRAAKICWLPQFGRRPAPAQHSGSRIFLQLPTAPRPEPVLAQVPLQAHATAVGVKTAYIERGTHAVNLLLLLCTCFSIIWRDTERFARQRGSAR